MPGNNKVQIIIEARDMAGEVFREVQRESDRAFRAMSSEAERLKLRLTGLHGTLVTLAGGYGIARLATSFLDTAKSFEQMQLKLDALTGGKGKETLEMLNKWALEMPVNTQEAIDTFVMMKAMGLDPTVKSMETLVNVAVTFGEDAMPRVARALGQMKTLGKLSAEELNQLAEAGINARKYLTQAFGKSVEEIQQAGISIDRVIQAIMQGLERDFGGAARNAMNNWQGLTAAFQSYVTEIQREIMEAGVFAELKTQLKTINDELANWLKNNRELIRQKVPEYIEGIKEGLDKLWKIVSYDPAITEYGLLGLALGGKKGAAIAGGLAHLVTVVQYQVKAFELWQKDLISFEEIATANFSELKELVDKASGLYGATGPLRFKMPQTPEKGASTVGKGNLNRHPGGGTGAAAEDTRAYYERMKRELFGYHDAVLKVHQAHQKLYAESALGQKKLKEDTKNTFNVITQFAVQAARNMQSAFSDFFFDAMQGRLGDLQHQVKSVIDRMVAEIAAAKVSHYLFGDYGKTGQIGGFVAEAASWAGKVFKFAEGGLITEPVLGIGVSGRRYLFGERGVEEVRPVSHVHNTANHNITINMNIQTRDAESFELSRARIASQISAAIARATS